MICVVGRDRQTDSSEADRLGDTPLRCSTVYYDSMSHQHSDSDAFSEVFGWRCPVSNSTAYRQILVSRPNGQAYLTEFFECTGCTLMFRHPGRFTRLGMPIRRWAMDVEPRTLREVHGLVADPGVTPEGSGPGDKCEQLRDGTKPRE